MHLVTTRFIISASLSREKSKLAFLEPGGSTSLSKTLPTATLQSMLQRTSPAPSSVHSTSTPSLQLAGGAQAFGGSSSSSNSQVGPSTQLVAGQVYGPQPPLPPPSVTNVSFGITEGDLQAAENQRY